MIVERLKVGVIDYGMGNIASLSGRLNKIGVNCLATSDKKILDKVDLIILPGVGAFPSAMEELIRRNLKEYLIEQAKLEKPIIGICLGMQLLSNGSYEKKYTKGLNLLQGDFLSFKDEKTHIGWSSIKLAKSYDLLAKSNNEYFYFNHSYFYNGPEEYILANSFYQENFASVIGINKILGIQFHPEKSQLSGLIFLKNIIYGLVNG